MHRLYIVHPSMKKVQVNNSLQHWAGCIMIDVCLKFHLPIGLGVHETDLHSQIKLCSTKGDK